MFGTHHGTSRLDETQDQKIQGMQQYEKTSAHHTDGPKTCANLIRSTDIDHTLIPAASFSVAVIANMNTRLFFFFF